MATARRSRILSEVHETAKGLRDAGLITKRRMAEYDALCLEPVPDYSGEKIHALRKCYSLSQSVLAAILNVTASTVQKWERGIKRPSGPSLKLLNLLDRKGSEGLV